MPEIYNSKKGKKSNRVRLLVTFTFGISLKRWHQQGLLHRELLIYKKMVEEGHKIGLLTYGDDTDLTLRRYTGAIEIFPVYAYIRRPKGKILQFFSSFLIPFKLASIFKDYDIYKTNQMLGSWVAVIAKFLYRKRLVARCGYEWLRNSFREGNTLKRFYIAIFGYFMELITYAASDRIIVSSLSMLNFIRRAFAPFAYKVVCIPNFIDVENFKRMDIAKTYNNRALYIGRLNRVKNLIRVFEALKDSKFTIGLDIIGKGKYLEELKEVMNNNKVDVKFLGTIPNHKLPAEINKYPVFVLASYFENNPKALLEAMSCERVVVGTNVEGIRDLIDDNISGILVSTDIAGIKKGLERAFGLSEDERMTLGRQARDFVTRTSSLDAVLRKEMGVYQGLRI